jgi:predicted transcriptional regulator
MTKKEKFIAMVEELIAPLDLTEYQDEMEYFDSLKKKEVFTEKGWQIISYMQNHFGEYNNIFKAKDIGEGLGISARSVSTSIRKLITSNFVEKVGSNPVCYSITELGKSLKNN